MYVWYSPSQPLRHGRVLNPSCNVIPMPPVHQARSPSKWTVSLSVFDTYMEPMELADAKDVGAVTVISPTCTPVGR